MAMLERIQKVIASGMLGLGLSAMAVPSVAQPITIKDLEAMEARINKNIDKNIGELKNGLQSQQSQINALRDRMDRIDRHPTRPAPASSPKRVVHIHRYYYRYWCPPWWY